MAHPVGNDKRGDKVEKNRVGKMTAACRASGGIVYAGKSAPRGSHRSPSATMRADGGAVQARADRAPRAKGGRTKSKGNTVNIVIAPSGKSGAPMGAMPGLPPPPVGAPPMAAPPPMRPPVSPAAIPPAPGPMPLPPRSEGGRAYARGGPVSLADKKGVTGISDRTPIQHSGNKSDTQNIGRKAVITKATGGAIYSDGRKGKEMAPHLAGGAGGGKERLHKAHSKSYVAANKAQAGVGRRT